MPDLSSNLTALRASGHKVRCYLAVFGGSVVASGTLDAAPATGAVALDWTRTAGSSSDIKPGYRVVVEDGSGHLKLETSVRYSGTISDSSIPIREIATAEFTLSASDTVKVYNTPVLTDKLVEANATFSPDGLNYSNQNTVIAPITNSGGHWAGFVDSGQTYATVVTSGGGSFTVDPDSGGSLTHLWTLPAGVAFQSGSASTDASPTLEVDAGYHVVTHRVTDSSNSATWTQTVLLRVYDETDRPLECVVDAMDWDETGGWSGRVRAFDDAGLADVPDRSLVAVFVRETIAGSPASFGNRTASRSHMKLVGYLARDENEGDGQDDGLTFEIGSPWARLQEIPGFSKALERYSSTTGWNYVQGLTVKRAILQILRWYTNWTECFDTVFESFTDYDYPAFYIQKNAPLGQMQELADGVDARVAGDRTGALIIGTRQELVALGNRSGLTTTLTLTDDDRITYQFTRAHFRPVEVVECRGFTASATAAATSPIYSRYPGVPGRGAQANAIERLIAASQANLNARCGLRGAAADGVFINASGLAQRAVDLELELPGSYDVFDPAYQAWVGFTGAAGNRRALDLSAFRFRLTGVSVQYLDGTARTTLRLTSETAAPAGQTYVPPPSVGGDLPDFSLEIPGITIPDGGIGGYGLLAGSPNMAAICSNGLALTADFDAVNPTWAWYPHGLGMGVGVATPSAFSYVAGAPAGWAILSNDRLYHFDLTTQTWTHRKTVALGGQVNIDSSILAADHVVGTFTEGLQGNMTAAWTTDDATYNTVYPDNPVGSGPLFQQGYGAVFCSQRVPGKVWVSARRPGPPEYTMRASVSLDYGATWAPDTSIDLTMITGYAQIFSPRTDQNPNETIWFAGRGYNVYVFNRINGLTVTDIRPLYGGNYYVPHAPRNAFSTAPNDARRLLLAGTRWSGASIVGYELFLTNSALSTPVWTRLINDTGLNFTQCAIAGDSASAFFFWGGLDGSSAAIGYSPNGGQTIVSKVGNLASFSPGQVVGLMGL